jgi:hypothetical protein
MTTDTQFTAEDFAKAIQYIEKRGVGPELEYTTLAALRIAQRVMTDGVIEGLLKRTDVGAFGMLAYRSRADRFRTALTREET